MTTNIFKTKTIVFFIIALNLIHTGCKKQSSSDNFCSKERIQYSTFADKDGLVGYSEKYKRFVVLFRVSNPNNIDESIVGFPCELQKEMQVVGKAVTLSGILKIFSTDENMTLEIAGQNLYFLQLSNIKIKWRLWNIYLLLL